MCNLHCKYNVIEFKCTKERETFCVFLYCSVPSWFSVILQYIIFDSFFSLFLSVCSSTSGPVDVKIENADSAVATVTGLEVGKYEFTLTVTDDRKLQSTDTVTVIVREG